MELQLVVFSLEQETFGVAIEQVREINRFTNITKVPKGPEGLLGVINLRGHVIPVVSLRERFGFPPREADNATRIVVSDVGGQTAGFVVDSVTEVLRLAMDSIEPAPRHASVVDSDFITGIGKVGERLVIVLDLERVLDFSMSAARPA
ncbi:MAG: chemotaxis protein CheW [Bacillota bacterium]|nr:chemotaxis protein CheW [Bacillota bacterium]